LIIYSAEDEPGEVGEKDCNDGENYDQRFLGGAHQIRAGLLNFFSTVLQLFSPLELGLVHGELLALDLKRLVLPLQLNLLILEDIPEDIHSFLIETHKLPLDELRAIPN